MSNYNAQYYTFQFRRTHDSVWCPKSSKARLTAISPTGEWCYCSWDWFRIKPFRFVNGELRVTNKAMYADYDALRERRSDLSGYMKLGHAHRTLALLRRNDAAGKYDNVNTSGRLMQRVRHEFRIVMVEEMRRETVVAE